MTQITLVLPYALPVPELAPDLIRALKTPALASLLSRARCENLAFDDSLRTLPHETWLARTLGLSDQGYPAFAASAMRGFGLDPGQDSWFIINPAHVEIARSHLSITDMRGLNIDEADSKALFATAKPYFDDIGKTLLYGDASTWFMRADGWESLQTASPDAAVGMNLTDWLPAGPASIDFRKLQNEIQMLWFEHDANVAREVRGLPAINSFWPWGVSSAGAQIAASPVFATAGAPSWLAATATSPAAALPNPFKQGGADSLLVCGDLAESAIAQDWAAWLAHMQRFESALFAPALAALKAGHAGQLQLVVSHRHGHKLFTTSKMAQHAFWRTPSLDRLLP